MAYEEFFPGGSENEIQTLCVLILKEDKEAFSTCARHPY